MELKAGSSSARDPLTRASTSFCSAVYASILDSSLSRLASAA
jgi:hypothetical protein